MKFESPDRPSPIPRFLRRHALRYLRIYCIGIAALLATNYITVLIPQFVQETIDAIGARPETGEWAHGTYFIMGLAILLIITRTFSRILFFNPGRTIEFRLKNDYYHHILRMGPSFFQRFNTGELISRGTNDMTSVRSIVGYATLQLFNVTIALTLTLYKMIQINGRLTLYCVLPFVLAVIILRRGIQLLLERYRLAQQQLATLSDTVIESYAGFAVLQGFNATPTFQSRFDTRNTAYVHNFIQMARIRSFYLPIVGVIGSGCLAIVIYYGGQLAINGEMTLGEIAAYAAYIGIVVAALNSTGWVINSIQRGMVSLGRVYEILDTPPELEEQETPPEDTSTLHPHLEVKGLSYRYPDAGHEQPEALSDIHCNVPAGNTLGIFGPTGSGKTTLLTCISRLIPPQSGSVFFGGKDLNDLSHALLRQELAMVPQDAYLFGRTVRENIAFSDLEPEIDDEQVLKAIEFACLQSDMESLPDGLNTVVGERGVTLSGGQRQRIALARARYRSFSVLILDDVLAAVDHRTEKKIIENIRSQTMGRTTLIASHRISALVHADEILVMDQGRVVDRGTHEELISRPGMYAEIWQYQQDEKQEEHP